MRRRLGNFSANPPTDSRDYSSRTSGRPRLETSACAVHRISAFVALNVQETKGTIVRTWEKGKGKRDKEQEKMNIEPLPSQL